MHGEPVAMFGEETLTLLPTYRHFVKEELPRIRWANPLLDIAVQKLPKTRDETWAPKATVEFGKSASLSLLRYQSFIPSPDLRVIEEGKTATIDMSNKWSTTIAKELMDLAGGDPWKAYKSAALAAGHPILPGEEKERLAHTAKQRKANAAKSTSPEELEAQVQEMLSEPSRPKTGAAAILP